MTVLQALNEYYGRMAARGEAEEPGYSREKISFAIVVAMDGRPLDKIDLRQTDGKRLHPRQLDVPAAVKRTVAILPNFLWDKTSYSLGRTSGEGRRTADEHAAFKSLHLRSLAGIEDEGLLALRKFLEQWNPAAFDQPPFAAEMLDTNIVFRLEGDRKFMHEREVAKRLVQEQGTNDAPKVFCLITGNQAPVRRLHPTIKGVDGAQSSGAALVSFNLDAFRSYGKEQGDNAPTSEAAAFRYGAALNRLLDRGSSRNRIKIADTTVVFWADASQAGEEAASAAENMFESWIGTTRNGDDQKLADDQAEAARIRDSLQAVADGRPAKDVALALTKGVRFHVLGLAPNAARLSVRYWLEDDFQVFARRLQDHFDDLDIAPPPWRGKLPSVQRVLVKTTALQEKFDNIPPLLAGETMRAILGGGRYPRNLLATAIIRLRAGDNPASGWHAAVAKACINRAHRFVHPETKELISVSLDPDNPSPAYQLGRLFAVLESAQYAALERVNASIADRYYGAASSTPARVFGTLMRSARNHISDAKKRGKGMWIEPKLNEIIGRLPADLPTSLLLEDQARFAVGYYHERASRFPKSAPASEKPDAAQDAN
ncbi:MAG TPA: type I-C CRISPR-associated protein Cas8c/Csd1 [Rhizomicrobium sp.]